MKVVFANESLKMTYEYGKELGKPVFGQSVVKAFVKKINILQMVGNSKELTLFTSLHFEALKRQYKGFHSIRVNDQYRIVFKIFKQKDGTEVIEIAEIHELTDYH